MADESATTPRADPVPLKDIAVDVQTALGASDAVTPLGITTLERLMAGGLRAGDFVALSGDSGVGKTALALFLAYIAARSGAATVVASPTLGESEVLARLAARAHHRAHPDSRITYGEIWSGDAWKSEATGKHVRSSVETVVGKVGSLLHLRPTRPFDSTTALRDYAAFLWRRHDRVVLVVDGVESFSAPNLEASADAAQHVVRVAYELRSIAAAGCAVIATVQSRDAAVVSPAATLAIDVRRGAHGSVAKVDQRLLALGARNVDLVVTKNRCGPTGLVPLRFIAGAATFEERAP